MLSLPHFELVKTCPTTQINTNCTLCLVSDWYHRENYNIVTQPNIWDIWNIFSRDVTMGGNGCGSPGWDQGCNIRNNLLIWKYFTDCSVSCPRKMGKKCGILGWVGWKLKMSKHSRDDWYGPTFKLYAPHKTLPWPGLPPPRALHRTGSIQILTC